MTAATDATQSVVLFDTTLRDGAQTHGVDFSVADKQAIAAALDTMGIAYVEAGWPGANPTDDRFFATQPALSTSKITAFGMTRRADSSAANDPGLSAVLNARTPAVSIVGKTWRWQIEVALGIPVEENCAMIRDSIAEAKRRGQEALFDAEHFFDGYKQDPETALACLTAAQEGGADWLVLCDTNGGTLPEEIERIVAEVRAALPSAQLGIHTHNDTGHAVANSLAAVRGGARMIQGTINGLGERCGNADRIALIPTLMLKLGLDCGVPRDKLKDVTPCRACWTSGWTARRSASAPMRARRPLPTRAVCMSRPSPRMWPAMSTSIRLWWAMTAMWWSRTRLGGQPFWRASPNWG